MSLHLCTSFPPRKAGGIHGGSAGPLLQGGTGVTRRAALRPLHDAWDGVSRRGGSRAKGGEESAFGCGCGALNLWAPAARSVILIGASEPFRKIGSGGAEPRQARQLLTNPYGRGSESEEYSAVLTPTVSNQLQLNGTKRNSYHQLPNSGSFTRHRTSPKSSYASTVATGAKTSLPLTRCSGGFR